MARIFISYKRVDKVNVFKIKDQIEATLGVKCWIDLDGIESDAQFKNVIINAINECEVVLFMYSKQHTKIKDFENDWTIREHNFAKKKNKRIVFVNLDGSTLTDIFEFDYGTKQQIDARSQTSMYKLITDLKLWLKLPSVNDFDNNVKRSTNSSQTISPIKNAKPFALSALCILGIIICISIAFLKNKGNNITEGDIEKEFETPTASDIESAKIADSLLVVHKIDSISSEIEQISNNLSSNATMRVEQLTTACLAFKEIQDLAQPFGIVYHKNKKIYDAIEADFIDWVKAGDANPIPSVKINCYSIALKLKEDASVQEKLNKLNK